MRKIVTPAKIWWGSFAIPENMAGRWRIGPLTLWVERRSDEWRLAYLDNQNPQEEKVELEVPISPPDNFGPEMKLFRFGMGRTCETLKVTPILADRPVVIRTETPFYLPAGQEVRLYISSPLWILLETGNPLCTLRDMPLYRPSDTWFGPNTMDGELCYASLSYCRLRTEDIFYRPHRAITVVLMRNGGRETVLLETLNLPVPHLSLYESVDGYLWTQLVTLDLKGDNISGALSLEEVPPDEAQGARLVCGPRQKSDKNILTRALSHLIH